jgi:hypothetical protein
MASTSVHPARAPPAHAHRVLLPKERRDIVWALLQLGGLLYDLERRAIVGLIPRPDMLHVLALGLSAQWERRGDGRAVVHSKMPRMGEGGASHQMSSSVFAAVSRV